MAIIPHQVFSTMSATALLPTKNVISRWSPKTKVISSDNRCGDMIILLWPVFQSGSTFYSTSSFSPSPQFHQAVLSLQCSLVDPVKHIISLQLLALMKKREFWHQLFHLNSPTAPSPLEARLFLVDLLVPAETNKYVKKGYKNFYYLEQTPPKLTEGGRKVGSRNEEQAESVDLWR